MSAKPNYQATEEIKVLQQERRNARKKHDSRQKRTRALSLFPQLSFEEIYDGFKIYNTPNTPNTNNMSELQILLLVSPLLT